MRLNLREQSVLAGVVDHYVATGLAVSSTKVAKGLSGRGVSPATVRSVMARLERDGYLSKVHKSSGRIPTEAGLRLYLDGMMQARMRPWDKQHLEAGATGADPLSFATNLGQTLAGITGQMAVVGVPEHGTLTFDQIALSRVGPKHFEAYLISSQGRIFRQHLKLGVDLSQRRLEHIQRFLNARVAGRTLRELSRTIQRELAADLEQRDSLERLALEVGLRALPSRGIAVMVEGASQLANQPEFSDHGKLKKLVQVIETKQILAELLNRIIEGQGVQVMLASEHRVNEISDLACVGGAWVSNSGSDAAAITLMGSSRMDYGRAVSLVNYATLLYGRFWERG